MNIKRIAHSIRSATPVSLRQALRRTGEFFGYGLPGRFPSIEATLATLKRLGMKPLFCVDVGAYTGQWAKMFRDSVPGCKILMIEAQDGKQERLRQLMETAPGEISMEMALLGPADGETVEFSEMETGSSVFAEASSYSRNKIKKITRRLDTILKEGGHPAVDFLKLDVQGYELEVLKGAPVALGQATAVLMEASLVPINTGCPLIAEVIAFMDQAGFRLFDFCSQIRRTDGVMWQTDLLFLRKDSIVLPAPELSSANWP